MLKTSDYPTLADPGCEGVPISAFASPDSRRLVILAKRRKNAKILRTDSKDSGKISYVELMSIFRWYCLLACIAFLDSDLSPVAISRPLPERRTKLGLELKI